MKSVFQIERTTLDRGNLQDLLDSIGYQPADVPGLDLAFGSTILETYLSASEVWEEAKKIRDLVSEVTEIDPEFVLGPVIDLCSEEPKLHHFLEPKSGVFTITTLDAILTVVPPDNLSEEQLAAWNRHRAEGEYEEKLEAQRATLVPAFREPRAVKLLRLLKRKPHTGETLYKIYELAEGHPSRQQEFQDHFGISEIEFKRSTDAAHNPVVSGDLARHAYDDKPKTDNPMTIAEAKSFVMDIARLWLASLR